MDEDDLLKALNDLSGRISTVYGDALFTGVIIGPLILMLIKTGALPVEGVLELIDATLLSLEKLAHPVGDESKRHVEHARYRLENLLKLVKGTPIDRATR
ncbi:MAG: hypothetical protein ACRYG8_36115 [Janthinobacterium lividum]